MKPFESARQMPDGSGISANSAQGFYGRGKVVVLVK
jgi:hypothetical protein